MRRRKLVIDRKVWLGGEDGNSYLLRAADGKRCCIGIYLRSLGISDERLKGCPGASDVPGTLPREANWLLVDHTRETCADNSIEAEELYGINDAQGLLAATRERDIADGFAQHGVDVEFVG